MSSPLAPYTHGLIHIWRVGSTYLTLSVTLERYCAICRPLTTTKMSQKYLLIGSILFATLYNIPRFFEMQIIYLDDEQGTILTKNSPMRENRLYKVTFFTYFF